MIRGSDHLLRQSVKKLFMIISASKEMYDLLGPGRAERWFYWKYRSREQVSHRNELWTVVPLKSEIGLNRPKWNIGVLNWKEPFEINGWSPVNTRSSFVNQAIFTLFHLFPVVFFINFLFVYSLNFLLKKLGFSKSKKPSEIRRKCVK